VLGVDVDMDPSPINIQLCAGMPIVPANGKSLSKIWLDFFPSEVFWFFFNLKKRKFGADYIKNLFKM
jgi:hypothetical protein